MKALVEIVKIDVKDVVTASGEWCGVECGGELPE